MGRQEFRGRWRYPERGLAGSARIATLEHSLLVEARFPRRGVIATFPYREIASVREARVLADRGIACSLKGGGTWYFWCRRHQKDVLSELEAHGVHVDDSIEHVRPVA